MVTLKKCMKAVRCMKAVIERIEEKRDEKRRKENGNTKKRYESNYRKQR